MTPETTQPTAFEAFLAKKKIDTAAFQRAEPGAYALQATEFEQLGPVSYDQRRKFYFNDWRLRYPPQAG